MLNKTINGYTIKRKLGEGGMAEVWYAENKIGKKAAVKILKPKLCIDEGIVERFENEAKVMVQLEHPSIRQVYDYEQIEGRPCIIMEYLEGNDLKSMLLDEHLFTENELSKWWNQLVDALKYTHQQGVIHRDIKPSNIFIDKHGNVKLLDFGIAKIEENSGHTQTGVAMGTRIYMSPEQVRDPKRVKAATDSYSLAVTFVHLLTGKAPYDTTTSSDFDIQMSIVTQPLDLGGLPRDWQEFLMPYLEKDAGKRPELKHFTESGAKQMAETRNSVVEPHSYIASNEATVIESSETDKSPLTSVYRVQKDLVFQVNGISFTMKFVEGGTFQMGAVYRLFSEVSKDESPVHSVDLDDFFIGETVVTQELWVAVMGNNPSHFIGDNLPVEKVSWEDCQEFIRKLNQLTGKTFRLPTEAEWEYAARGGNRSEGFVYAGGDNISDVAWYDGNSKSGTHPVKSKMANELELYDMCGDVWEWCQDWYFPYYYALSPSHNPQGPSVGAARVIRGGSWNYSSWRCRLTTRYDNGPNVRNNNVGFRLVLAGQ